MNDIDAVMVLTKKLDKYEKTFMNMSEDVRQFHSIVEELKEENRQMRNQMKEVVRIIRTHVLGDEEE